MTNLDEKGFTDLYFIAAVMSYSAHSLIRIDKTESKYVFYFRDDISKVYTMSVDGPVKHEKPGIDMVRNWYVAGILMYPPSYPQCIIRVKSEVHS